MIYIILVILSGIIILLIFYLFLKKESGIKPSESFQLMQEQISSLRQEMSQNFATFLNSLQQTTGQVNTRLDNAAAVIRDVSKSLGVLEEGTRRIREIGQDISRLQEILRAPKARGVLGELFLEELLSQLYFPADAYRMQYRFKSGEKCDAVLLLGGKLLPIDAKFPLEDFKRILDTEDKEERRRRRKEFFRQVKNHIDAIAQKYIRPEEGTFDFAFMYIPAENVYYEMIVKEEGEENPSSYALSKRVIPVSPNSFYAYLQAILLGLRGLAIEKRAEEILSYLSNLSLELSRFREDFETLGKHIANAFNKYQEADKKFSRLEEKFSQTKAIGREDKSSLPPPG
ncbi:MAG: DNA recombination protein RmuC [candidate division WOR-3 bacterium]